MATTNAPTDYSVMIIIRSAKNGKERVVWGYRTEDLVWSEWHERGQGWQQTSHGGDTIENFKQEMGTIGCVSKLKL